MNTNTLLELDLAAILRTTKLPMAVAEGLHRLMDVGGTHEECALVKDMMAMNNWELRLLENKGYGLGESLGYKGGPEISRIEPKVVTLIWL
jgi:hypothetical protein